MSSVERGEVRGITPQQARIIEVPIAHTTTTYASANICDTHPAQARQKTTVTGSLARGRGSRSLSRNEPPHARPDGRLDHDHDHVPGALGLRSAGLAAIGLGERLIASAASMTICCQIVIAWGCSVKCRLRT